jgi:hypothetical protein
LLFEKRVLLFEKGVLLFEQGVLYPASKVLSYFFSARHREARETLQNLCIFFVEPTIQKLG